MPAKKKPAPKKDPGEIDKLKLQIIDLERENEKLKSGSYCYMCGKFKPKSQFYKSTNPIIMSHLTPICKDCANNIALRKDLDGRLHKPTKESVRMALRYLDKPFFNSVYESSIRESSNDVAGRKTSVWPAYIKNISMVNYDGLTFADSDFEIDSYSLDDPDTVNKYIKERAGADCFQEYVKNKRDVVRLLGYDPFEKDPADDQPFLYSQLIGMLDSSEDGNDDMLRTASAINIVRNFLQQSKIDNTIAALMSTPSEIAQNSATINGLQSSKEKLTKITNSLAAESCLSLKNSKTATKGENTWTGKLRKIRDLNLRDGEVNGFDINTCKAMKQVMDLSNASILEQLHLDESEYSDMIAEQRQMITSLNEEVDKYKEISRILLRENMDLKDTLDKNELLDDLSLVNLNEIYSSFAPSEVSEEVDKLIEGLEVV